MTGNIRFFINKENFEKNKDKYSAAFDASVKDTQDKGKYYLVDMAIESLPETFAINNHAIEIHSRNPDTDKPSIIYAQVSAPLDAYAEIKIFGFMVERYRQMREAMITAISS